MNAVASVPVVPVVLKRRLGMYNLDNVIVQQRQLPQLAHLRNRLERHTMWIGIVLREMGTIETVPSFVPCTSWSGGT